MKQVELTQGYFAIVDDEDYELVCSYNWHVQHAGNTHYGMKKEGFPERKVLYIHRLVMNAPSKFEVDHINGNGLDCRKENLRLCTSKQNKGNVGIKSNNTSGYKGVVWDKWTNRWKAQITHARKTIFIGRYDDPQEAAKAYDELAIKYFGEFARTNKMEGLI